MRHLTRLIALLAAALVLTTHVTAQAEPGTNFTNYSDGSISSNQNMCTWAEVPVNAFPPDSVTVPGYTINCPSGTSVGDLIFYFDAGGARLEFLDVIGGAFFFWCRYHASNLTLTRTDNGSDPNRRAYTGSWSIPLHSSNWPEQCANPMSVSLQVTFRRIP